MKGSFVLLLLFLQSFSRFTFLNFVSVGFMYFFHKCQFILKLNLNKINLHVWLFLKEQVARFKWLKVLTGVSLEPILRDIELSQLSSSTVVGHKFIVCCTSLLAWVAPIQITWNAFRRNNYKVHQISLRRFKAFKKVDIHLWMSCLHQIVFRVSERKRRIHLQLISSFPSGHNVCFVRRVAATRPHSCHLLPSSI